MSIPVALLQESFFKLSGGRRNVWQRYFVRLYPTEIRYYKHSRSPYIKHKGLIPLRGSTVGIFEAVQNQVAFFVKIDDSQVDRRGRPGRCYAFRHNLHHVIAEWIATIQRHIGLANGHMVDIPVNMPMIVRINPADGSATVRFDMESVSNALLGIKLSNFSLSSFHNSILNSIEASQRAIDGTPSSPPPTPSGGPVPVSLSPGYPLSSVPTSPRDLVQTIPTNSFSPSNESSLSSPSTTSRHPSFASVPTSTPPPTSVAVVTPRSARAMSDAGGLYSGSPIILDSGSVFVDIVDDSSGRDGMQQLNRSLSKSSMASFHANPIPDPGMPIFSTYYPSPAQNPPPYNPDVAL